MTQYVDKSTLVAEINKRIEECNKLADAAADNNLHSTLEANELLIRQYTSLLHFLDTIEVEDVKEKSVNEDLEDYAKKESESFAEREYEIDYIDRNALAKGYYWGVKAGAQWQKQKNAIEVKEVNLDFQRFSKEMEFVFTLPSSKTKNTEEEPLNWEYAIAKHFFELGLKAKEDKL